MPDSPARILAHPQAQNTLQLLLVEQNVNHLILGHNLQLAM